MNVGVAGLDHVGTVTSANVTSNGHDVWGVDVGDAAEVDETGAVARWQRRVSLGVGWCSRSPRLRSSDMGV